MDKSKIRLCKKPHLHFLASNFLSFVFLTGHEGILFLREGLRIIPSVAGFSSPPTFCQQVPISVLCYHLRAFYSLLILYRTIGQDWYSKNNKKYTFSLIDDLSAFSFSMIVCSLWNYSLSLLIPASESPALRLSCSYSFTSVLNYICNFLYCSFCLSWFCLELMSLDS